jgi:hypothetical protein
VSALLLTALHLKIVKITDELKKAKEIEGLKTRFSKFKIIQPYIMKYHFLEK